jgi:hypothetical protein
VLAGVFAGLLWRSVAGPSGPLPLALAAAVGFLLSLVSQGIYGRGRSAATWTPPRWPSLPDPLAIRTADRAGGGVRR